MCLRAIPPRRRPTPCSANRHGEGICESARRVWRDRCWRRARAGCCGSSINFAGDAVDIFELTKPVLEEYRRFARHKTREALSARIERLSTVFDDCGRSPHTRAIGNAWSAMHYGGGFCLVDQPPEGPALSLVFVQSKDGNTGGADPGTLGGGATDEHLIYEGLSRVAADAVLAGAGSLHPKAFFSVWHPQLVALRAALGLPRHPAQIVISQRGTIDLTTLLFNVPEVPVILLAGDECISRHGAALRLRPWIQLIRLDDDDLRSTLHQLRRKHNLRRISAIGGRSTATHLVDLKLAQDIYLTTTARNCGHPGTPWYSGTPWPQLTPLSEKEWSDGGLRVVFQHMLIG
jgi:riboflavin biosynthesis pyrimidine reductase